MAGKAQSFEDILSLNIDTKNRRIYFGSFSDNNIETETYGNEFSWSSVEKVIRAIHFFENKSTTQPIEIYISSPGGDIYDALRLIDVIQSSPCQIKFIGSGLIASSAAYVMVACDERIVYPNTMILIHDSPSSGEQSVPNKLSDAYIDVEETKRLQQVCNDILTENSRMFNVFWSEIVKRDTYITPEEGIMLGIVDSIIEPKKRGTLRKNRIANLNQVVDKKELSRLVKSIHKRIYKGNLSHIEVVVPNEQFDDNLKVEAVSDEPINEGGS